MTKTYTQAQNEMIQGILDSDAPDYVKNAFGLWKYFAESATEMLLLGSCKDSEFKITPNEFFDFLKRDLLNRLAETAEGTLEVLKRKTH